MLCFFISFIPISPVCLFNCANFRFAPLACFTAQTFSLVIALHNYIFTFLLNKVFFCVGFWGCFLFFYALFSLWIGSGFIGNVFCFLDGYFLFGNFLAGRLVALIFLMVRLRLSFYLAFGLVVSFSVLRLQRGG